MPHLAAREARKCGFESAYLQTQVLLSVWKKGRNEFEGIDIDIEMEINMHFSNLEFKLNYAVDINSLRFIMFIITSILEKMCNMNVDLLFRKSL